MGTPLIRCDFRAFTGRNDACINLFIIFALKFTISSLAYSFQVPEKELKVTAEIIKRNMETAMSLSVKLPVKVKVGASWGTLQDIDV